MLKRLTLALALWAGTASADPRLIFSGVVNIAQSGGLSGLEILADGQRGIVVSDRGALFAIELTRSHGVLSHVRLKPWPTRAKIKGDVEGIATRDGKTYYFSLEKPARVMALSPGGALHELPKHPNFSKMLRNKSLEALAIDPGGRLFTLPEYPEQHSKGQLADPRLYSFVAGQWYRSISVARNWPFHPVGADFGPDGKLYILERAVGPLGFRARVRRFDFNHPTVDGETLLTTWPSEHDNLEGISLWQDQSGATRVLMVSDDNFSRLQRSQIVEYILQE